jgi:16S rRNA (cytosine967-C5)-methyltransferase
VSGTPDASGVPARRLAAAALLRIEDDAAYANLVLGPMLDESDLDERDRHLVTELVYGTTRMRRACDHLVDRFVPDPPTGLARSLLRLGAYQIAFMRVPAHAAVSATVGAAPKRLRGFVNAVLRRVSSAAVEFPDDATRLSYPDWIIERLTADLGAPDALGALEAMNRAASATVRADGYIQDLASQRVAGVVGAEPGDRVVDLCAAPGGKATALAAAGAWVVAGDRSPARAGLMAGNVDRLGSEVSVVVADAAAPPVADGCADRVLLDAPCTGLGALRRRPDARWRVRPSDVDELAAVQLRLVEAAARLVRPGGVLVYSVCTLTAAESTGIDAQLVDRLPEFDAEPVGEGWRPHGRGGLLLPQEDDTDGMFVLRLRRSER